MQYIIIGLAVLLIAAIVAIVFLLFKKQPQKREEDPNAILLLQQQINQLSDSLNQNLTESTKSLNQQFQEQWRSTSGIIRDVTERLTKLDDTNRQVVNFADQLQSLENVLRNPKHRGILGEYYLETLLGNVFQPKQYQLQYCFKNNDKVDAVIFVDNKIVPIDAKFSLEKYNQLQAEKDKVRREEIEKEFKSDIKKRIDETAKYIRPAEKTTDFAFMFIPAEGIYSNLLVYKTGTAGINTHDLLEYAFSKRVIIVSPTSFFAYLQTVIQGLKSLKVEEGIMEIVSRIKDLDRHLNSYQVYMTKLGKSMGTSVNMYNEASKEFKKIDKDIYRITDGKTGGSIEMELLDRPKEE
jgi:DNA recombination protein RmuC